MNPGKLLNEGGGAAYCNTGGCIDTSASVEFWGFWRKLTTSKERLQTWRLALDARNCPDGRLHRSDYRSRSDGEYSLSNLPRLGSDHRRRRLDGWNPSDIGITGCYRYQSPCASQHR